jgi:integrase
MSSLTAKQVENAKPTEKRQEIPAGHGLYLIVQPKPSGNKMWCVRYRFQRRTRKLTLPSTLTLAEAREQAAIIMRKVKTDGIDPAAEAKPRLAAGPDTFEAIATQCLRRDAKRLRSADRQLRDLDRLVFPTLGHRLISEIKRSDVVRLLDQIEDENGEVMADAVLSRVGKVMRWYATRSDDYMVPLVRGMSRSKPKERARDRILDDKELRAVWTAVDKMPVWFAGLIKFLLLTAARRGEALGLRREEIADDGTWTCPAARSKTKVAIKRPLSKLALQVLASIPPAADGFVFSATGVKPAAALSREKAALDKASGVTDWTIHDLRRTARSLLAKAGVPSEHAERCLAHTLPAIEGRYNRHPYDDEMAAAYRKLAGLIAKIVTPPEGKVVSLPVAS